MTYSLLARDPATGRLGAAVQSHWFSVGSIVLWGRPGTGVVATQSIAEPAYGPNLLDRLARGDAPGAALAAELAADEAARFRQVAVLAPRGAPAVHTGEGCVAYAGHVAGADACAHANMMAAPGVAEAMLAAFDAASGALAQRLLAALRAAEAAGGDLRGAQSAALLVVGPHGEPWRREIDVRIDDHTAPVDELARLVTLAEAYGAAGDADEAAAAGRHDDAAAAYARAVALAPDSDELAFWAALAGAAHGDPAAAAARVAALPERWRTLLDRVGPEIAPAAPAMRAAIAGRES